jgi:Ca2+/Na+ antiporter
MAKPIKSVSYYFLAFPIIDNHKSFYKPIVAILVICQYAIVTAGLVKNRELLIQIWQEWEKIP